tara:strand:+ start:289 stop:636 length:348 start_codon:yes stop_codon:yes gene_type:complete
MDCKIIKIILVILFFHTEVTAIEFKGKFIQGHFILGKTDPESKIIIDKKVVKVSKDGYFAFGLGRDRKNDVIIIKKIDNQIQTITKKILKRKYNIQKIDGLPKKKLLLLRRFIKE